MPEKFNFIKTEGSFANWFFLESTTSLKTHEFSELLKGRKDEHDVCLTINGVEVSFVAAMTQIEKSLDDMISKKASELIDEKCSDAVEFLLEVKNSAKNKLAEYG